MRLALCDLKISLSRSSALVFSVTLADHWRSDCCLAIICSSAYTKELTAQALRSLRRGQTPAAATRVAVTVLRARLTGLGYFTHDQIIATTVIAIVAVASQPMICSAVGRVNLAMTVRRIVINIIVTINGTATTPLRTALQ